MTKQEQEKCTIFGTKAKFAYDDGITFLGRRLANFECMPACKIVGKKKDSMIIDKYTRAAWTLITTSLFVISGIGFNLLQHSSTEGVFIFVEKN